MLAHFPSVVLLSSLNIFLSFFLGWKNAKVLISPRVKGMLLCKLE